MSDEKKVAPPQPTVAKPAPESGVSSASSNTTPKELSAEEQMAQYEDSLKETDWGHQPC